MVDVNSVFHVLSHMEVHTCEMQDARVYVLDNIREVAMADIELMMESLPQWRREKVLSMKNGNVRRESVLAFALLMLALQRDFGMTGALQFSYNDHGKPRIDGHDDVHFNISHCRDAVACVISNKEVGIDVERRGRYKETLARHVLNDEELMELNASQDKDIVFTVLWTKKEALLKKLGTGVSGDMKDVLCETEGEVQTVCANDTYVCSVAI